MNAEAGLPPGFWHFVGSVQPSMMRSSRCGARTVQQLFIRASFALRGMLHSIGLDRWVLDLSR